MTVVMIEALTLPFAAVAAGVISFSSPCCLPLVPGYLSYISALPVSELPTPQARRVTLLAATGFVAGFTLVFTALGVAVSFAGASLLRHQDSIVRGFGAVIIVLGLSTMGLLRVPVLARERRVDLARVPRGPAWSVPMGMAFAAGWTPCVGPVLATVLATASVAGTAWWGGLLLALYSIGFGLPFIGLALGFGRAQQSLAWLRSNTHRIERVGGVLLVTVGVLFMSGRWVPLFRPMQAWFARYGWPPV